MTYTIGNKISEDIKSKILNDLTYEQMIHVESDLNNYKWNSLLGEPPVDFNTLPDYESKWYKKTSLYKSCLKIGQKAIIYSLLRLISVDLLQKGTDYITIML